jgi:hypothetical protein
VSPRGGEREREKGEREREKGERERQRVDTEFFQRPRLLLRAGVGVGDCTETAWRHSAVARAAARPDKFVK